VEYTRGSGRTGTCRATVRNNIVYILLCAYILLSVSRLALSRISLTPSPPPGVLVLSLFLSLDINVG